jgi:hypothetical protein
VSPVRYELGFYIPEDDILHSHCRKNLKSNITLSYGWSKPPLFRTLCVTCVRVTVQKIKRLETQVV